MCISPLCNGSETAHEETSSILGFSGFPSPSVSHSSEPASMEVHVAPAEEESCDREEAVDFETSRVPIVEVERAQLPLSLAPCSRALTETLVEEGTHPEASQRSVGIVGSSPASYFRSDGPQVIRCFQVASWPHQGDADSLSAWPHLLSPLQHHCTAQRVNLQRQDIRCGVKCFTGVLGSQLGGDGLL